MSINSTMATNNSNFINSTTTATSTTSSQLNISKHISYFTYHLKSIPYPYITLDTSRLTVLYFICSGIDILINRKDDIKNFANDDTNESINDNRKESKNDINNINNDIKSFNSYITSDIRSNIIKFIYSLQVKSDINNFINCYKKCGFRGSPYIGIYNDCDKDFDKLNGSLPINNYDEAHIAQTYTAICVLSILNDDFKHLNKIGIIKSLSYLQESNGSFRSMILGGENDMRFIYCAFVISSILNDWSGFNVQLSIDHIIKCQSYDGGFGLNIGNEGHGGSTYCAVACLYLVNRLDLIDTKRLLTWCINRQGNGYSGRMHKPNDTCYSFWIGGTIEMLKEYELTNSHGNREFNLTCQGKAGGFGKWPDIHADILHSYFSLCGLSMMGLDGLQKIYPAWGLSMQAKAHVEKIFHNK